MTTVILNSEKSMLNSPNPYSFDSIPDVTKLKNVFPGMSRIKL